MNVVLINGSARKQGNTQLALETVGVVLKEKGIETKYIQIGQEALHGCIACGYCAEKKNLRCVFTDDSLNAHLESLFSADGIVVGSPVYYAGINGALKCFLDRAFFVGSANGSLFRHKVGAGVVAVRRGGEIAAWDQLNKYFTISEMFVPSSTYWNMAFGFVPGEATQDPEGLQTMRTLGENMAWLLQSIAQSKQSLPLPEFKKKVMTNFIR